MDVYKDSSQGQFSQNVERESPAMGKLKANRVAGERLLRIMEAATGRVRGERMAPRGIKRELAKRLTIDESQVNRIWGAGDTASVGAESVGKVVRACGIAHEYFVQRSTKSLNYRDYLGGNPDPFPPKWFEAVADDDDSDAGDDARAPVTIEPTSRLESAQAVQRGGP